MLDDVGLTGCVADGWGILVDSQLEVSRSVVLSDTFCWRFLGREEVA